MNELLVVYHGDDHMLIRAKIDGIDQATQKLAEDIMNTVVKGRSREPKSMPKLTWSNLDDIASGAVREVSGSGPDPYPLHGSAQVDHGAGGFRRRSAEIE